MKKLLIPIVLLMGVSCTIYQEEDQNRELSEALNNIQDMKEWMQEDKVQGVIDPEYADYYIEYLDKSEDLLIEHFYNINTTEQR